MTTAAPTHPHVSSYAMDGQEDAGRWRVLPDCESQGARTKAIAGRMKSVILRRRLSEDEIVRAAITVILVALGTLMVLAAMATLTMGS